MKTVTDINLAKSETEAMPVRGRIISIKKDMSTQEIEAWLKEEEKAIREFKRIKKRIKITIIAVKREIRIAKHILRILEKNKEKVHIRLKRWVSKTKKLEQRLLKHIKKLKENFMTVKKKYALNNDLKARLKQIITSLEFYEGLFFELWKGGFGLEKNIKEWEEDSFRQFEKMVPIYLRNLEDLLTMLEKLYEIEEGIVEVEKRRYDGVQRAA